MNSSNKQNSSSTSYAVENNVPVPPKRYARKSKYPFDTMAPNQSVLIPGKTYAAVIGVLRKHKAEGKRFVVRNSDQGIRVWRIE